MSDALVTFERVSLAYGRRVILRDLSFTIARGSSVGLVGPNGSGKTTILRAILGLLPPASGDVRLLPGSRHDRLHVGYVPQRDVVNRLLPFSALEVVSMVATARRTGWGWGSGEDRKRACEALATVGIAHLAHAPYADLSGGQRQRVLLARALVIDPDLLLLDEPTSGLDLPGEASLLALIRRLREASGITVLTVSHFLPQVAAEVDHVMLIQGGSVLAGPTGEILTSPRLSALYGMPVRVARHEGRPVVFVEGAP